MAVNFFGGNNYDFGSSAPWDVPDYGGTSSPDYSSTGYPGIGYGTDDYSGYDGGGDDGGGGALSGAAQGAAAGAAFGPWGALIGAGVGLLGSFFGGKSKQAQAKQQLANQKELYAFQLAEQEKYRQQHGKELADAMSKYEQYQRPQSNPFAGLNNVQSPFNPGMVPQYGQPQGLLNGGF